MITPSEICIILYILQKLNSIKNYYTIALLFIQTTVHFPVLKGVSPFCSLFFCSPKITQSRPQVFSVNGSIICNRLHFWRHFDVIGSVIFCGLHFWYHWFDMTKILSKFGEQQLVMVNYTCGFDRSETGKYFEWIIMLFVKYRHECFTGSTPLVIFIRNYIQDSSGIFSIFSLMFVS